MSAPLVSIVTPAHNLSRFISSTVQSVLDQTFTDFELLVVDDCSTDDTVAIVDGLARQDPRVRLLRTEVNGGPSAARNVALEAARGRYIAFLDGDDEWEPTKLEEQVAFMRESGAAISFTAYHRVNEEGQPLTRSSRAPAEVDYSRVLRETVIPTSSSMIDVEQTGPFRMKRCYYDDYALWLDLLGRGHVARGLQRDLMRYRVRSGSWSRNKLRSSVEMWKTYRHVQRLPLHRAAWYFAHYAVNSVSKLRREYARS